MTVRLSKCYVAGHLQQVEFQLLQEEHPMNKLLQVDFGFQGPFGQELSNALTGLAESINNESGLIWKIWTENQEEKTAGGIYLFENEVTALADLEMHTARLKAMGITEVRGKLFDLNQALSLINKGPIA